MENKMDGPRTTLSSLGQISSGLACYSCGMSNKNCLLGLRVYPSNACCTQCSSTDTHDEKLLPSKKETVFIGRFFSPHGEQVIEYAIMHDGGITETSQSREEIEPLVQFLKNGVIVARSVSYSEWEAINVS